MMNKRSSTRFATILIATTVFIGTLALAPGAASKAHESTTGDDRIYDLPGGDDGGFRLGGDTRTTFEDIGIEWDRALKCRPGQNASSLPCAEGDFSTSLTCDEGDEVLLPLWKRYTATSPYGETPWVRISDYTCAREASIEVVITAEDFRIFPVAPSTVTVQPNGGKALVRMPTIFFTEDTRQVFIADLLGMEIELVAEATEFDWTFSGSDVLTTSDPGHPYPDHTVSHEYLEPGLATPALATTWTGHYRVEGGPWQEIDGTVSTDSTIDPIELVERRTYLVSPDR